MSLPNLDVDRVTQARNPAHKPSTSVELRHSSVAPDDPDTVADGEIDSPARMFERCGLAIFEPTRDPTIDHPRTRSALSTDVNLCSLTERTEGAMSGPAHGPAMNATIGDRTGLVDVDREVRRVCVERPDSGDHAGPPALDCSRRRLGASTARTERQPADRPELTQPIHQLVELRPQSPAAYATVFAHGAAVAAIGDQFDVG
jgi:hypothetical protein